MVDGGLSGGLEVNLCGEPRLRAVNRAKRSRTRPTFDTMTHKRLLVGTSLLSVLLLSVHLAQDALRAKPGTIEAGPGNLTGILILVLMLAGPTLLADSRSGRSIMAFIALAAMGMPALHFSLGGNLNNYTNALLFVWGLLALGVNGAFSLILWVSELRRLRTERRMTT